MDHDTMYALWKYWRIEGNEKVKNDNEPCVDKEEGSDEENEIAEIFRIETDIFDYESPLCKAFDEFNYLFQIDPDVLTKDIPGFKTYEEYKDDWIYEWNDKIPWVNEKPWKLDGMWKEPTPVKHHSLEDSELKEEALRNKAVLEESMNQDEKSSNGDWSNYLPIDELRDGELAASTNIDDNPDYNPYLDIARLFNDHASKNEDIGDLDNYLVQGDAQFNKDNEGICEVLGVPHVKPPACKTKRFEVVKYSFGQMEKFIAIKVCGYYDWTTTEENACHAYQDIFHKMDEGWFVIRAE
ncbi:hypothetical protein Tco_0877287 [Tanacetum coccineum]|uniref:Uncharacterized protein n=1 Tax=Tanacetum coccineum TaxID=301880 RepID=A0ABQ5BUX4_9ASTR